MDPKKMSAFFITTLLLCAPAAAHSDKPLILFDEGHGQRFTIEQKGDLGLYGLAEVIHGEGIGVKYGRQSLDPKELSAFGALIISGPFAPFSGKEIDIVEDFVRGGGRLAVMLHIGQPVLPLLDRLGVRVGPGVIHEEENVIGPKSTDFSVTRLEEHPLHAGLEGYSLYGAWGLEAAGDPVRIIALTGPRAWLDTDRDHRNSSSEPHGQVGVAAAGTLGKGAFVVFGDDAIFQNRFLKENNRILARNLARWLAGLDE
jgi:hypothetical protein